MSAEGGGDVVVFLDWYVMLCIQKKIIVTCQVFLLLFKLSIFVLKNCLKNTNISFWAPPKKKYFSLMQPKKKYTFFFGATKNQVIKTKSGFLFLETPKSKPKLQRKRVSETPKTTCTIPKRHTGLIKLRP